MKKSKLINPDPTLKNNLMAFGYESEDGWKIIIDECVEELEKESEKLDFDFEITQIKEKFGTLQVYLSSGSNDAFAITDKYQIISSHVCEHCGEFYTARTRESHHWLKTLCDKCADELNWK
jgi:hypothetical protein